MEFFTKKWFLGKLPENESKRRLQEYKNYLKKIFPKLPITLRSFALKFELHDGLLEKCTINQFEKTLQFDLICGDLQKGYFRLKMVYLDVDLNKKLIIKLKALIKNTSSEILYDEIGLVLDKKFVHRILFWPDFIELDMNFSNLKVEANKLNKRLISFSGKRLILE